MSKVKALLEACVKTSKAVTKTPRAPSAYIIFTKEKRKELAGDAAFTAMAFSEKATHLGTLWKSLGPIAKEEYEAKSAQEKAALASAPPPEPPAAAPASFPMTLELKSEKAMDKLIKDITAVVTASLIEELQQEGGSVSLPKVGKLSVKKGDLKSDGAFTASFKPSKPRKAE